MYFRELPSPLLCDHLYEKFSEAVSAATDEERLVRMQDVLQQLPPPHYRTLEYLMRHLACLVGSCSITNMHAKNLAIVWAPNLLRSPQSQSACVSGGAAFMEVQMQSAVVEFILNHTDVLFSSKSTSDVGDGAGHGSSSGPKSPGVSSPSTKLLTLEEAQARARGHSGSPVMAESRDIEVEEGPAALQGQFHTVIDFPSESTCPPRKMENSAAGCWCSCFSLGKPSSAAKRQLRRDRREPSETGVPVLAGKGANPAFKTLLYSTIEFLRSVRLYPLLAFKPGPSIFR
ncbi:rho GTPase-activating protein 32-like [Numida meleagris]|uniref:rho GTPase-activating protein 32-like n=1 Tax=Numida meleagris TaxID=8996 RepID=UPI000B3DE043|nr:rho GTPase-activating protein 32-like [Numida meleagris]